MVIAAEAVPTESHHTRNDIGSDSGPPAAEGIAATPMAIAAAKMAKRQGSTVSLPGG